jgi:magnesium-transporting ATPase (P-type)
MKFYASPTQAVLDNLKTSSKGLTANEVALRRAKYGLNQLTAIKKPSAWFRFFRQFHNILIYILLLSGIMTLFLQHWVDSFVIFGVVIINSFIGFIQEGKAEKALEAIQSMLSPNAVVIRDGHRHTVQSTALVPGDIVLLQSGDKVPADIRLLEVKTLQVQEAILTGESNPITKQIDPVSEQAVLGDRRSMVYSGTLVVYGRALGVVTSIGMKTEIGRISAMLQHVKRLSTPLLKQMEKLGRFLTAIILSLAVVSFFWGVLFWGESLKEMFLAAVGLAVAAIPEGLPAIITITLAIGVTRMAKKAAIIRRLPAVEIMGAVSTICTDKTGTLTRNEMAVQTIVTRANTYQVKTEGDVEKGNIVKEGDDQQYISINQHLALKKIILGGLLCNDAEVQQETDKGNNWHVEGNPVDGALLMLAIKAKLDLKLEQEQHPRLDLIPFESQHKWMASLNHDHEGHAFIFLKGAPERLLVRCKEEQIDEQQQPIDLDFWKQKLELLASQGQRVLAIAYRPVSTEQKILNNNDIENDFIFLGLVGLIDPPRVEVPAAVKECAQAGINVKMITGDHAITAQAIAQEVGITNPSDVLTGDQLNEMSDDELAEQIDHVNVYARTSPAHKLKLVQLLQKKRKVVAMTGDGVNDAPALKQADIGIAMGKKGTEAAKEASEMVLADDNFASIKRAVKEGRTIYDNLKKAMIYVLPTNVAESLVILFAIIFGLLLPITPVQILWVNMITTVTLSLAIAFEKSEINIMQRPPRPPTESLLSMFVIWRSFFVGALFTICIFLLFEFEHQNGGGLAATRTTVVNMLVMAEAIYLLNCRKIYEPACFYCRDFFENHLVFIGIFIVVIFQMLFTYLPVMQHFFGTAPIEWDAWFRIIILSILLFVVVELEKWLIRFFKLDRGHVNEQSG